MMSYFKTTVLLAALTAILLWLGHSIGGQDGLIFAFMIALVMNGGAYWFSDKMVLSMNGAKPVSPDMAPELYRIVESLTQKAKMPMPKIYIIESAAPNAFATGRNPSHAAVAATTGILQLLNEEELTGVLGHELSHVKNRDTLISTIAAVFAGAIGMLANMFRFSAMTGRQPSAEGGRSNPLAGLIAIILAPIAAALVQMAISRSRELEADKGGAELTEDPAALASALLKIEQGAREIPYGPAERNPSTAHLFIINPLIPGGLKTLFSTHPSTEERVKRLMKMRDENPKYQKKIED